MRIEFNVRSADDYRKFLKVRRLPIYEFHGSSAVVPDEYASEFVKLNRATIIQYTQLAVPLFDYQEAITRRAIETKFAIFADCGLAKR
ncbi:MAG UNVERIFIED_CONTAM: hypothetical protein LVR18_27350 [Planctomycetaceae bacterium]